MLGSIWDKISKDVSGAWLMRALVPALAFFTIGVLTFALSWPNSWHELQNLAQIVTANEIAAVILGLIVLLVSSGLVKWFTLPALRIAEGYWPWLIAWFGYWRAKKINIARQHKLKHLQELHGREPILTPGKRNLYARLDQELLLWYPDNEALTMPTRLGNILRAAEEYPLRYGLEINTVLPRLWLVIPDQARKELENARQVLDDRTSTAVWCLLLVVWVIFTPWMALVALVCGWVCYQFMVDAAKAYALLMRAAFDLYRFDLYEQLHWPAPKTPAEEEVQGKQLNSFLYRFDAPSLIEFTDGLHKK